MGIFTRNKSKKTAETTETNEDIEIFIHVWWSDAANCYFFDAGRTQAEAESFERNAWARKRHTFTTTESDSQTKHERKIKELKEKYCKYIRDGERHPSIEPYTVREMC